MGMVGRSACCLSPANRRELPTPLYANTKDTTQVTYVCYDTGSGSYSPTHCTSRHYSVWLGAREALSYSASIPEPTYTAAKWRVTGGRLPSDCYSTLLIHFCIKTS
ncbi:hypothetical protein J6590_048436 [Homalodisca vitripennis]|nr:hypothetical protein J6590_048436 [Homalodisca vitripennis]